MLAGQWERPWASVLLWMKLQVVLGIGAAALFRPYRSGPELFYKAARSNHRLAADVLPVRPDRLLPRVPSSSAVS